MALPKGHGGADWAWFQDAATVSTFEPLSTSLQRDFPTVRGVRVFIAGLRARVI